MRSIDTTKAKRKPRNDGTRNKTDWRAFDALTDEEADEKERRGDDAAAGCVEGAGCCLIDFLITATAFAG